MAMLVLRPGRRLVLLQVFADGHVVRATDARGLRRHQAGEVERSAPIAVLRLERHTRVDEQLDCLAVALLACVVQQCLAAPVWPAEVLVARYHLLERLGAEVEVGGCLVEESHSAYRERASERASETRPA